MKNRRVSLQGLFFVVERIFFFALFFVVVVLFLFGFLFVIIVIVVFGKNNNVHGMSLGHFEFGVALRAGKNLAFLYFIFVEIDLSVAFGTLRHVTQLLPEGRS
jgi:hypothetical protein